MPKFINPLTIALYAAIVGYLMAALFSRFPVSNHFIVNSVVTFIITVLFVIGSIFILKKVIQRLIDREHSDN